MMSTMQSYKISWFVISFLIILSPVFAQTYTINQSGGADYTDLNIFISDLNTSPGTTFTAQFTDASPVTYTLSPGQQSFAGGKNVTFTHASAGIVTVDGRLDVANGGGTFTANNIHFQVVATSYQWCILHGYDGQFYTNCTFGPAPDNGVVVRSGGWTPPANFFQDCIFSGITNSSIIASWGNTNVNNCSWDNNGRAVHGEGNNAGGKITVNGGAVTNTTQQAFVVQGFNVELNGVTVTGGGRGIHGDWQNGNGVVVANNCDFLQMDDRIAAIVTHASWATTITLNNCLLERKPTGGGDPVHIDNNNENGGKGWITVNGCRITGGTTGGSGLVCWKGGHMNVNNTIVEGTANSMLVEGSTVDYPELTVNHSVFVNASSQVLGVGAGGSNATVKIYNSIIDASNASGLNFDGAATKDCEYNMINAASDYYGSVYITGDPQFMDPANSNYHIWPCSPCVDAGMATALTVDIDGDSRPLDAAPDIGVDEVNVTYTVNQSGGADYTDLNTCITDINSSPGATIIVEFTDASPVTYTLSPGEQTIANGIHLTFVHCTEGIVTIDGRLNVANAGGSFTARNIHFQVVATSYQWCMVHGYDGQWYYNCTFGPAPDNGVVVRSGGWSPPANLFQDCAFNNVTNSAIIASWGNTEVNNCTWDGNGRAVLTEGSNTGGNITVNGGGVTNITQQGFAVCGFNLVLNDVVTTGGWRGITGDWQNGNGTAVCNNCEFRQMDDRIATIVTNSTWATTITLNNCLLERKDTGGSDGVFINDDAQNGGKGWINLNACRITGGTTGGSMVVCWKGGHMNVINTIVDGGAFSLLFNGDTADYPELNVIHSVLANASDHALGTGGTAGSIKIYNSIVDASNASGLEFGTIATKECEHNMINATSDYYGFYYITGDPKFIDPASGDYHIHGWSPCMNEGTTDYSPPLPLVTVDMDGESRPNPALTNPDIGADEYYLLTGITDWYLY